MAKNASFIHHFEAGFKLFHELMSKRVREILLVSSPYDAFIMEEDGFLGEKISNEYQGLNLNFPPPKLSKVTSASAALKAVEKTKYDLVITMPRLIDMSAFSLGKKIKRIKPSLPVVLLTHSTSILDRFKKEVGKGSIDQIFVWLGSTDILLAIIKWTEDRINVNQDTQTAMVRVIIYVEDSPYYSSSILPLIYKEIVNQTRAVMEDGLNPEHQLLKLRARPKILLANSYEEALSMYKKFRPFLMSVIADTRFPRNKAMVDDAGVKLLSLIRQELPHLPLLLHSSDNSNQDLAKQIPAQFLDKNSPTLHQELCDYFVKSLGFGDFVFRRPDAEEIARASNLRTMERILPHIPPASLYFHVSLNHFSKWLMARSEVILASKFQAVKASDFSDLEDNRKYLISNIHSLRIARQKGVVVSFSQDDFDPDAEFLKMGNGSMGGKARGLAFLMSLLAKNPDLFRENSQINIILPKTLVITTDGFDAFIAENGFEAYAQQDVSDKEIMAVFAKAKFPKWVEGNLRTFLQHIKHPLAVRSSSLLEDNQFQPYAGLYSTHMIPNSDVNIEIRLYQLIQAIKLVYASVYFQGPRTFSKSVSYRTEEEKMAIIIQQLIGQQFGDYFYPDVSGVAQSQNFYPISYMKPKEGIVHMALGFGKIVVEGGKSLRFSPKYPQFLPQFSKIEDILKNSQRYFFALKMTSTPNNIEVSESQLLVKREICDVEEEAPIKFLASTYDPEDHRIRDTSKAKGYRVITFAQILKYQTIPLAKLFEDLLRMAEKGIGCPVEIEFSMIIDHQTQNKPTFALLQLRPMATTKEIIDVEITPADVKNAFGLSSSALGNGTTTAIYDILYVKHDSFQPSETVRIANQVGKLNATIAAENRKYLLIGPGRWGSSDKWLGIPIIWNDISNAAAIVETSLTNFKPDPSQGTHLFQNITSLGIHYLTISQNNADYMDWEWLGNQEVISETTYLRHIRVTQPIAIRVSGKTSRGILIKNL